MAPKVPDPPPPPAMRQEMKPPEFKSVDGNDAARRRRGFAALMVGPRPSLQPPMTTGSLGG